MLSPATFQFLSAVAQNNNRDWFNEHRDMYEMARADALQFTNTLIATISKIDPTIESAPPTKKCLLRIYRDVRFSLNKAPYKNNFGIWIAGGLKGITQPGYYVHIQPENCFIAGGCWMPPNEDLKRIRQEIDYNPDPLHAVIDSPAFSKLFTFSSSEKLKNAPKGYSADHPEIELLKLKSFEVTQSIPDQSFLNPLIVDKLKNSFSVLHPFIAYLRSALEA